MVQYFQKRRIKSTGESFGEPAEKDDDPMSGVANLFDIGLVFIVGLLMTLFSTYHLADLFDQTSEMTIMKQHKSGQMEIITKKGRKVKAMQVSKTKASGQGERLGIAYRLKDGSMVYVPEGKRE
jgi:hypothetical protein